MGIAQGADYNATVTLTLKDGDAVVAVTTYENVHNQDVIVWDAPNSTQTGNGRGGALYASATPRCFQMRLTKKAE